MFSSLTRDMFEGDGDDKSCSYECFSIVDVESIYHNNPEDAFQNSKVLPFLKHLLLSPGLPSEATWMRNRVLMNVLN